MCTAIVSIDPRSTVPVLLAGVRDEFLDRPWRTPGRHWPRWPQLLGGQDLEAGGTWLAVHPDAPRVATVLNGRGRCAGQSRRRSRGELPLLLAANGELAGVDPSDYDPFHLVCAEPGAVRLWSWNGEKLAEQALGSGLHIIVNSGLDAADGEQTGRSGSDNSDPDDLTTDDAGLERMRARVAHLRPLLARERRPEPRAGDARSAWGGWFAQALGGGLDPSDQRALVVRGTVTERRWGTSSVSLVALGRDGARYDFCPDPTAPEPVWSQVLRWRWV